MDTDALLPFFSLVFLSAGLGIDNGLLIEFSIKSLNLPPKKHLIWRSVALFLAALLRIAFLFSLSLLSFLQDPMPESYWFPNYWFVDHSSEHREPLTWMSFVLFLGGVIILAMAIWEYYHKLREAYGSHAHEEKTEAGSGKILAVVFYLAGMNILFSLDSVFAAVAMMDINSQFGWMVAAILLASLIMVWGMIPISAIIAKNKHFGVLMLSILSVIATKLLVDGTGAHFSNGLLMFIIGILLVNDAGQAMIDKAVASRKAAENAHS